MGNGLGAVLLAACLVLGGVRMGRASSTFAPDGPPALVSPYRQYDLQLRAFRPAPNRAAGVLLPVRINGRRPLRLILDSGAEYIVIGAKAGRSLGLSPGPDLELVGLGSRASKLEHAQTVEVGPISFRNCRVALVEGRVIEGADGVIPLSLFSDFLVRLDLPGRTLGLIPNSLPQAPEAPSAHKHRLLLVPALLNRKQGGYVALDTGAFCSGISQEAAHCLSGSAHVGEVRLAAGTGAATGERVSLPIHFAIAGQDMVPRDVVALDLSDLTRHCGVEVLGVVGYPELSRYVLTVDYRNDKVRIEPPSGTFNGALEGGSNVVALRHKPQ